jgi:hypothetical protein
MIREETRGFEEGLKKIKKTKVESRNKRSQRYVRKEKRGVRSNLLKRS